METNGRHVGNDEMKRLFVDMAIRHDGEKEGERAARDRDRRDHTSG